MKVSKWGNSLAVRLPAELIARLGLKDGDEVAVVAKGEVFEVERVLSVDEALANLRSLRGRLPSDFKFDREEANSRGHDDKD
jgi:antitoxin MazE